MFCNALVDCPVTLAVWGHGDATPNAVLTDTMTIPSMDTHYFSVEGNLATGDHPLLRFEVYNLMVGQNIRFSSTVMHR